MRAALSRVTNASVSFDPGESFAAEDLPGKFLEQGSGPAATDSWLEILVDGLTFDLVGLAPGPQISVPPAGFRIDFAEELAVADFDAIGLAPGPHLSGGHRSLVVARAMAGLGSRLAGALGGVAGLYWLPSDCVTGTDFFVSNVEAWIDGGPFPALGMTVFAQTQQGGLRSVGLSFFTGQEIEIPPELAHDRAAGIRLGMRLVHQLAAHGTLGDQQAITGPDGRTLQLTPNADGNRVHVRVG